MRKLLLIALLALSYNSTASDVEGWSLVTDYAPLKAIAVEASALKDVFIPVEFSEVYHKVNEKGADVYCGRISLRNSVGAYSGWTIFYVIGDEGGRSFEVQRDDSSDLTWKVIAVSCKGTVYGGIANIHLFGPVFLEKKRLQR